NPPSPGAYGHSRCKASAFLAAKNGGRRPPLPLPASGARGNPWRERFLAHSSAHPARTAAAKARVRLRGGAAKMVHMSLYALQKLIRDVNRKPACREAFFQSAEKFAAGYDLAQPEREALIKRDVGALYAMGVHGLLLRPFTLL